MVSKKFAKPLFDMVVTEYDTKVVGAVTCNKCGKTFTVELKGSPEAMKIVPSSYKINRLFQVADQKHACDADIDRKDPAETNRIINKYHEYKERQIKDGIIQDERHIK
jgi:hypothetical protein